MLMHRCMSVIINSPVAPAMAALLNLGSTLPTLPPQDSSMVGFCWFNPSPWSTLKTSDPCWSGSPWTIYGQG